MSTISSPTTKTSHLYRETEDVDNLPAYSSRRSSYSFALSDAHLDSLSTRKLSEVTASRSRLNSFELTPSPSHVSKFTAFTLSESGSNADEISLASIKDRLQSACLAKKFIYATAMLVTLLACILMIVGICLLIFAANGGSEGSYSPIKSLGYFFSVLGVLVILLSMSIIFSISSQPNSKAYRTKNVLTLLEASPSQTLISHQQKYNDTNQTAVPPEITITSDQSSLNKFPLDVKHQQEGSMIRLHANSKHSSLSKLSTSSTSNLLKH